MAQPVPQQQSISEFARGLSFPRLGSFPEIDDNAIWNSIGDMQTSTQAKPAEVEPCDILGFVGHGNWFIAGTVENPAVLCWMFLSLERHIETAKGSWELIFCLSSFLVVLQLYRFPKFHCQQILSGFSLLKTLLLCCSFHLSVNLHSIGLTEWSSPNSARNVTRTFWTVASPSNTFKHGAIWVSEQVLAQ